MTFAWTDYVTLAEELSKCTDEAARRCSISRAYYGAYCQARDSALLPSSPRANSHRVVHDHYVLAASNRMNVVGNLLSDVYSFRLKADYDTRWTGAHQNADRVVRKARTIEQKLSEIPSDELQSGRMRRV